MKFKVGDKVKFIKPFPTGTFGSKRYPFANIFTVKGVSDDDDHVVIEIEDSTGRGGTVFKNRLISVESYKNEVGKELLKEAKL